MQTPWGLRWVHVEVDGEAHFEKPRCDETLGQQKLRDRRKDAAAWEQRRMLVRLHYLNRRSWGRTLQQAATVAGRRQPHRFIIYTYSYGQLGLKTRIEAL